MLTPESQRQDRNILLGFVFFNLVFRLILIHLNTGEYTDGILQITQFERHDSFWPPLYTALIWLLRVVGIPAIDAGRSISIVASALLLVPIWTVTKSWAGRRAALFALALYTVAPLPLRWSLRVMTDMSFLLFLHLSCAALLSFAAPTANKTRQICLATVWAVAATLSRYHGALLAPLIGLALLSQLKTRPQGWWKAWLLQALWLALPVWMLWQKFGHIQQVGARQAGTWWETLVRYWDFCEMFIYILPYTVTLPVFALFLVGLIKGPVAPRSESRSSFIYLLFLYITVAILVAQSVFQAFQERYLLPLLPLMFTFAGAGLDRMECWFNARGNWMRRLGLTLVGAAFVWPLAFGLTSLFLQREAFGDLYAAGAFIKSIPNLPADFPIYTNESYKPELGMNGIKLAFASGHPALMIPELAGSDSTTLPPEKRMLPGSIVVVHSAYGGLIMYNRMLAFLRQSYNLKELTSGPFYSAIVPLYPDIMEEPGTHQSPVAWGFRYYPQRFKTQVFQIQ
jgi:hypothetical protein